MLQMKLNRSQYNTLQGLAYWIADINYLRERYGDAEPEIQIADSTIKSLFAELDRLHVPFWVQNTVIVWAEDWRRYKRDHMDPVLAARNITF